MHDNADSVYLDDGDVQFYHGDVVEVLRSLPAGIAQTCITSPPYWGLRDYGTGEWTGGDPECDHRTGAKPERKFTNGRGEGAGDDYAGSNLRSWTTRDAMPSSGVCGRCGARRVDSQLGLEPTPGLYVERMVGVFREVWRVLRDDGTVWLNIGSSYYGGPDAPLPITRMQASWLAALIDGEGCIQVHQQRRPATTNSVDSFQCDVGVGMMTPDLVQHAHRITRLGVCNQQNRGVWDWSVRGQQAATLLRCIYPYLIQKRGQAALTIMLAEDLAARKYGRGNPADPKVMEWRAEVKQAVSDLNQRKGTTMKIHEPEPVVLELKQKDDCGIPWMLARALRADGWYLRSEIIWAKSNPMPESVSDRPTKSHEQVFLLTKQPRYFYDADAIREPPTWSDATGTKNGHERGGYVGGGINDGRTRISVAGGVGCPEGGRNRRSVWTIPTEAFPEAHFATFPQALVEPCIKAGTSERGGCAGCGAPWIREVEMTAEYRALLESGRAWRDDTGKPDGYTNRQPKDHPANVPTKHVTTGWRASCSCDAPPVPQTCLDPFVGSGTTALVARRLGRRCIGIDLSAEYLEIAARRTQQLSLLGDAS